MPAVHRILGSGWLLAWQIALFMAFLPLVAIPAIIQTRASLTAGLVHDPLSLSTLGQVGAVAAYFFAAALVNGILVARVMGAHWLVSALLGLAAASGLCVMSGTIMFQMADLGGPAWLIGGWVTFTLLLIINLGAPAWAAADPTSGQGDLTAANA